MDNIHVTSSEIGDFVYCPRAWWLRQNRINNTVTPQMLRGTNAHNRLSFQLDSLGIRKIIIAILLLFILVLLIALIGSYFTKL